ncbi:calpain-C-like [Amphibalanus amphitrite]|uniref:calpain-C-like n=1 Tax=Amphibalanus amphitrite TaxID=1232801 RepID=UPI001C8FFA63|nr:calpain-C-like [Amphibalanus amphitrite]
MDSEYERIRRSCLRVGELWQDPDFPAVQASVFYHQTPPFQFVWKRPAELFPDPLFIRDSVLDFDAYPGKLGDRWFISCIGCLQMTRGLFYRVVPADQSFAGDGYAGIFRFRIFWNGEWVEVLVDDRLPTVNGKLAFTTSQSQQVFWMSLLEKACAKLHGSYEALKYGTTLDGLADMTGGITETLSIREDATGAGHTIGRLLEQTSIITATVQTGSQTPKNGSPEKLANGVLLGTNYRVLDIERVTQFSGEPTQLVRLRSSLGHTGEYVGRWARGSLEWDEVSALERERLGPHTLADGEFWMPYSDFVKTFTHLEVVHLDEDTARDEPSLRSRMPWQVKVYQGSWRRGVTAGGCRNNTDTFHINPRLHLVLSVPEEVVISLTQHTVTEPRVVGFTVYPVSNGAVDAIDNSFFKKKSLVNSQYTNGRQVSHRCALEPGGYIIVPTTFEPSQEAQFTLRVFSMNAVKLRYVDTTPAVLRNPILKAPSSVDGKGFNQYEAVFLQLADEHKTVNAFELQELLEACLPNDYIKSCATIGVCRQIIFAMDTTMFGRLSFNDFKDLMCSLKLWQGVFKNHTKEKTGVLKAERFRDALAEVGFQLNTDVMTVLTQRYRRKDGTLRFGDFVAAVLQLCVAFEVFDKKDPLQTGIVKFNISEWLKGSLSC